MNNNNKEKKLQKFAPLDAQSDTWPDVDVDFPL